MNNYRYYVAVLAFALFFSMVFFMYHSYSQEYVSMPKNAYLHNMEVNETSHEATTTVDLSGESMVHGVHATSTIIFVGDVMLSRAIGSIMVKKHDWTFPFLEIGDYLRSANLVVGNLEGPISDRGTRVGSMYSFRADPHVIDGLLFAGFDVMSVANNHMWDYSKDAYNDTLAILEKNAIGHPGGGATYTEAHTPVIRSVGGTKVAFLSYTNLLPKFLGDVDASPAAAFPDIEQMTKDIHYAKNVADIVIVSFHFGEEYMTTHNASQESLAHSAVDAGASLVIGHHPHVPEDIEQYKGVYIVYSLGNFVFDQNFSDDTRRGLVIEAVIKDKKIINLIARDIAFTKMYQPYLKEK